MSKRHDEKDERDERKVAGNAARDPEEQSCREDLPEDVAQESCEEPYRGTQPGGEDLPRLRLEEDEAVRGKGREQPTDKDPERQREH